MPCPDIAASFSTLNCYPLCEAAVPEKNLTNPPHTEGVHDLSKMSEILPEQYSTYGV